MRVAAGEMFNMGGGAENSTSLLELLDELRELTGNTIDVEWGSERLGDQRWYVADTSKIRKLLGWTARMSIQEGLRSLYSWYLNRPSLVGRAAVQVA